ncbi:MAG TPA: 30S ribosomal protein S2, partial [Anaerolineae bacterium]
IDYLLEIEKQQARGEFARLIKKEALQREREIARLNHRLGGLKEMRRLPNYVFIVDVRRDSLAVKEANVLGIPIIAMVDTNCDPDPVDHVIPSNDDAIRAIKLMIATMANAVAEGQHILSTLEAEEEEAEAIEGAEAMERYLGPSTLAKIQAAEEVDDEDEAADDDVEEEEDEAEEPAAVAETKLEAAEADEPEPEVEPIVVQAEAETPSEPEVEAEVAEAEVEPSVEEDPAEAEVEPSAEEEPDEEEEAVATES